MKISVITATRNRPEFLAQAIASVKQTILAPLVGVSFEHIVYEDRGGRGPSFTRNQAIHSSAGDYIFVLDDDDLILQRTLYNFARAARDHPATDWFTADFIRVDADGRYLLGQDYYGWEFDDSASMLRSIFAGEHFIQHNVFFRRRIFDEAGGFDEELRLAEDLDLFIRFLRADHRPHHCHFISHLHRLHPGNLSYGIDRQRHLACLEQLRKKYS